MSEESSVQLLEYTKLICNSNNPNLTFFKNINNMTDAYAEYVISKFNKWKDNILKKETFIDENGKEVTKFVFKTFQNQEDIFDIIFLGKVLLSGKDDRILSQIRELASNRFITDNKKLNDSELSSALRSGLAVLHSLRCATSHNADNKNSIQVFNDCISINVKVDTTDHESEQYIIEVPLLYLEGASQHKINPLSQDSDLYLQSLSEYADVCELLGVEYSYDEEIANELIRHYSPERTKMLLKHLGEKDIRVLNNINRRTLINIYSSAGFYFEDKLPLITKEELLSETEIPGYLFNNIIEEDYYELLMSISKNHKFTDLIGLPECYFYTDFVPVVKSFINEYNLSLDDLKSLSEVYVRFPESRSRIPLLLKYTKNHKITDLIKVPGALAVLNDTTVKILLDLFSKHFQDFTLESLASINWCWWDWEASPVEDNIKEIYNDFFTTMKRLVFLAERLKNITKLEDLSELSKNYSIMTCPKRRLKFIINLLQNKTPEELLSVPELFFNSEIYTEDQIAKKIKNNEIKNITEPLTEKDAENMIYNDLVANNLDRVMRKIKIPKKVKTFIQELLAAKKFNLFSNISPNSSIQKCQFLLQYTEHGVIDEIPDIGHLFNDECSEEIIKTVMDSLPKEKRYLSTVEHLNEVIWYNTSVNRLKLLLRYFGSAENLIGLPENLFIPGFSSDDVYNKNLEKIFNTFGTNPTDLSMIQGFIYDCYLLDYVPNLWKRIKILFEHANNNVFIFSKYPEYLFSCEESELSMLLKEFDNLNINSFFLKNDAICITNAMLARKVLSTFDRGQIKAMETVTIDDKEEKVYKYDNFLTNLDLSKLKFNRNSEAFKAYIKAQKTYDEKRIHNALLTLKQDVLVHIRNAAEHMYVDRLTKNNKNMLLLKDYSEDGRETFSAIIKVEDFIDLCEKIMNRDELNKIPITTNLETQLSDYFDEDFHEELILINYRDVKIPGELLKEFNEQNTGLNNRERKEKMKQFIREYIINYYYKQQEQQLKKTNNS